jgi:hypothetical protein
MIDAEIFHPPNVLPVKKLVIFKEVVDISRHFTYFKRQKWHSEISGKLVQMLGICDSEHDSFDASRWVLMSRRLYEMRIFPKTESAFQLVIVKNLRQDEFQKREKFHFVFFLVIFLLDFSRSETRISKIVKIEYLNYPKWNFFKSYKSSPKNK